MARGIFNPYRILLVEGLARLLRASVSKYCFIEVLSLIPAEGWPPNEPGSTSEITEEKWETFRRVTASHDSVRFGR